MSGILAVFHLDDRPVDPRLLDRMAAVLVVGAVPARTARVGDTAGLAHAPLEAMPGPPQPFSPDGDLWIVADARVDDRDTLIGRLRSRGHSVEDDATPAELILHAYRAWGESCVDHLLGDFAFAIWDDRRRQLFCARDHFGVKPFYYARMADVLLVSNVLNCIRHHPDVSDELNEQAIGDFLLFDANQDPATTAFADIARLPAAHTLTWSEGQLRVRRYWTLPIDNEIRYDRPQDYVEHFRDLLQTAVADRVGDTHRVGVFMSGGLDSSAVAASAKWVLARRGRPGELVSNTIVFDRIIPDQERKFSRQVAHFLGIPINYFVADDPGRLGRNNGIGPVTPEPTHLCLPANFFEFFRHAASSGRVMLSGDGPDALLRYPMQSHLISEIRKFKYINVAKCAASWVYRHRRLPHLKLSSRISRIAKKSIAQSGYPCWLNPDFEERQGLREKWVRAQLSKPAVHGVKAEAYNLITDSYWEAGFESRSSGVTRQPVEVRNPYFDLRVVRYLLALPPIPWCVNKSVIRGAMRGHLPESVRLRRKAPLAGDLIEALRVRNILPKIGSTRFAGSFASYVDVPAFVAQVPSPASFWTAIRPISFNRWLIVSETRNIPRLTGATHGRI